MADDLAKPDRPFYLWLEDVRYIQAATKLGSLSYIPFWWACYKENFSPIQAVSYNMEGMKITVPNKTSPTHDFESKPFPGEPPFTWYLD